MTSQVVQGIGRFGSRSKTRVRTFESKEDLGIFVFQTMLLVFI